MFRAQSTLRGNAVACLLSMIITFCVVPTATANAGLLVTGWNILNRASVSTDDGGEVSQSNTGSSSPVPITDSRYNAVGNTSAFVAFSYDWFDDSAAFHVDSSHQAVHPTASLVQATTRGVVFFTPNVDSLVTVRVRYNYVLNDGFMEAVGAGGVSNDSAAITYINLYVYEFSLS
jgi:hypothetical protein